MDFSKYQFRCSQLGKLMTSSRSKSDTLSQTAKSYLDSVFKDEYFGKTNNLSNQYTEKGIRVEDDAIKMLAQVEGKMYDKNVGRFYNNYIQGEPDVISHDEVIDIKSSWNHNTFPLTKKEIPTKDYYYQLQGYMWLLQDNSFNIDKARLIYCLMDTPENLIDSAKRKAYDASGGAPLAVLEEIDNNMRYSDIDPAKRLKVFHVEFDPEVIENIIEKIEECREYLNNIVV